MGDTFALQTAVRGKAAPSNLDLAADFAFTGNVTKGGVDLATTSDATSAAQSEANLRTMAAALSASLAVNSQKITGLLAGTSADHAVNKGQLDSVAAGLDVKPSVKAATTANITLSGEQTIDGVSVVAGDRVLVKNQSTGSQNGIYIASASSWARASDLAAASDAAGAFTFVEGGGPTNEGKGFVCTSDTGSAIVGTDALVFTQFSGGASYSAGNGIDITGSTISAVVDPSGPITVGGSGLNIDLATDSVRGAMSPDHYTIVAAAADGAMRATHSTTGNTPWTMNLPAQSAGSLREYAVRIRARSTDDDTKACVRHVVFGVRRGASGDSVVIGGGSVELANIADTGTGNIAAIAAAVVPGTGGTSGQDTLSLTGISGINIDWDVSYTAINL